MNTNRRKTTRALYKGTRRGTNDTIKTHAICSKDYITHNGRGKTLENYSFEHLKCGFECQD